MNLKTYTEKLRTKNHLRVDYKTNTNNYFKKTKDTVNSFINNLETANVGRWCKIDVKKNGRYCVREECKFQSIKMKKMKDKEIIIEQITQGAQDTYW